VLTDLLGRLLGRKGVDWYRELHRYKYQVLKDVKYDTKWALSEHITSDAGLVHLSPGGMLWVRRNYCWDGPSGPTLDTSSAMRASLIHDALYQLMREGKLGGSWREPADAILRRVAVEDGMWRWRAKFWERMVNRHAAFAAEPDAK
jgi:hypothetical protein